MKTRIERLVVVAVSVLWGFTLRADDPEPATRDAIAKQVERINEAWRSDTGAQIMRSVLSDAFAASLPDPGRPGTWITVGKEEFCTMFGRMLQERRPKEHVRQTTRITVHGGIAYENGVSVHVTETESKRDQILNVWRQEGDAWRLFFSVGVPDLREAMKREGRKQ